LNPFAAYISKDGLFPFEDSFFLDANDAPGVAAYGFTALFNRTILDLLSEFVAVVGT